MNILITGVNGFIGNHLAVKLIERGHSVIGIGLDKNSKVLNLKAYYKGSVLDKKLLENAIKNIDAVVHLAAITSYKDILSKKSDAFKINLQGTKNVLDVFVKSKTAKKFLYPSTGKVYGTILKLPITENHPTNPLNILGKSKLKAEKIIKSYNNNKKSLIILRIFNVYGLGQKENFLIPTIIKQLSKNVKELVLGNVEAKRDYVYIDDAIDAFVLAIEKKIPLGFSTYNICTGIGISVSQILKLISKIKKTKIKIRVNPDLIRTDEMKEEYGSFKKVSEELGWKPKINIEEGLKRLCKQ